MSLGAFSVVGGMLRLAAARWPLLVAFYAAGWLARYLLIELAAVLGSHSPLLGVLVMPLAVLARLGSFIAMFLVLRDSMPAFSKLEAAGATDVDLEPARGARPTRVSDVFLVSILPFFAFYAAYQFLHADQIEYESSTLSKINFFVGTHTGDDLEIRFGVLPIVILVLAFAARILLKRYAQRLPRWVPIITVYLEALWVYLLVFFVNDYFQTAADWVHGRAVFVWFGDIRSSLTGALSPLGWAWSAIEFLIGTAGGLLVLPVAWLTIAGVMYGRALATSAVRWRLLAGATRRYDALPRRVRDVGDGLTDRIRPITNSLVLIWRAGVVPMGSYVLAFTVLEAASTWLFRGAVLVFGAHDLESWWMVADRVFSFVIETFVTVLEISLIAAAYDFCLRRLAQRRAAEADPSEPDAESVGQHVGAVQQ
jgi:hypothetical protein